MNMFRLLSIFLLTILHVHTYAQNVVVSATQMNVLYIGIDNPVEVAAEGLLNKELIVRISDGCTITPITDRPGNYNVRVSKAGSANISVYQKLKNGNEKLLSEQKFEGEHIPDPILYIGDYKAGVIAKENLKKQKGLFIRFDSPTVNLKFDIVSFTLYALYDGVPTVVENNGAYFNDEVRKLIDSTKPGDPLFFNDIVIVLGQYNGVKRKLAPVTVIVDGLMNRSFEGGKVKLPIYPIYNSDSSDYLANRYTRTTLVGGKTFGTYDEYYPEGIQKIHGQFILDTTIVDTVLVLNPKTLIEELCIEYYTKNISKAEWLFYDRRGVLERREVYEPKKNRWVIDK